MFLGMDVGTGGTRAVLVNEQGQLVASASLWDFGINIVGVGERGSVRFAFKLQLGRGRR